MKVLWKPQTVFSKDRKYRYVLHRRWDDTKPLIGFVGLNPSTADESINDPTIRRMIGFAKDWGYGGVLVGNIFALRSTDPKKLYTSKDPVGPDNNEWLNTIQTETEQVVACWGTHGHLLNRGVEVRFLLFGGQFFCVAKCIQVFGLTKYGYPKHPLYLSKNAKLESWVDYAGGFNDGSVF